MTQISRHNSTTSPDIVLSNRYGHLNTRITPELSTNPILIPCNPTRLKNANWGRFKGILQQKVNTEQDGKLMMEIDRETNRWFQDLIEAKDEYIPKRSHRTAPHPRNSPEIQLLQASYNNTRNLANWRGLDQELRNQHATIRG